MKLKTNLVLIAALLAGGCAHAPALNPDKAAPEVLASEGSAEFNARDLSVSRAGAVLDAEKKALLRVARLYMDDTAIAEKSAELENAIVRDPQPFVAKYKIVSEGQDGAYYRVRLKVWVNNGKLASALRALNLSGPAANAPRAALVRRGQGDDSFAAAFRDGFTRRSGVVIEDFSFARDAALLAGPKEQLLAAAAGAGADLVMEISAAAAASGAGLNTGFFPARADASVRAYEAASGRELFSLTSQGDAIDSSQQASFAKALAAAGELLAQQAAARAERSVRADVPMRLRFNGLDGLETLEKLKAQLERLDAKALRLESYSSGTAFFEVVPRRPDPQELASGVLRGDSLGLELDGAGPLEVVFSLQR